jgi:hypothetical protein
MRWLYLEVKPCDPQAGDTKVLADAEKLIDDNPSDPRDQLRGVFAYGFRWQNTNEARFGQKYKNLSNKLVVKGFSEVGICKRKFSESTNGYVQTGLWVLGQI